MEQGPFSERALQRKMRRVRSLDEPSSVLLTKKTYTKNGPWRHIKCGVHSPNEP